MRIQLHDIFKKWDKIKRPFNTWYHTMNNTGVSHNVDLRLKKLKQSFQFYVYVHNLLTKCNFQHNKNNFLNSSVNESSHASVEQNKLCVS